MTQASIDDLHLHKKLQLRSQINLMDSNSVSEYQYTHLKMKKSVRTGSGTTSNALSFVVLGVVFASSLSTLLFIYLSFPDMEPHEKAYIKLPRNMDDAKNLGGVLSHYRDDHYMPVLGAFFITYIFLQSFAIPGSIFLSVLSGFLFPFPLALFLVCLCSSIGASFCYMLSFLFGKNVVQKYMPERTLEWQGHVDHHRDHLFNYIIFLRITPFLPNWFINITSPVINVPLTPFFVGTFLGVAPPSFVAIHAGTTLHQLTSSGDVLSWTSIAILGLFAVISLLPVIFKNKLREKLD